MQRALEEDHRDGQPDDGVETFAQRVGPHDVGEGGPEEDAGREQEEDAGYACVPRDRLRNDARGYGEGEGERRILEVHESAVRSVARRKFVKPSS